MEGDDFGDSQSEDSLIVEFEDSQPEESCGGYFEFAQPEDSLIEFDEDCDLFVKDSVKAGDEKIDLVVGPISEGNGGIEEIVEDTYEKDEKESSIEDVAGQEECSCVRVSEVDLMSGPSVRNKDTLLSLDLNEVPTVYVTPPLTPVVKEARGFDLNKLPLPDVDEDMGFDLNNPPVADGLQIEDGLEESTFILVLLVRVPGFN